MNFTVQMRELGMDTKEQIEQLKLAAEILQEGCDWEYCAKDWYPGNNLHGALLNWPIRKVQKPDPFAAIKAGMPAGKKYEIVNMDGTWSEWVGGLDFGLRKAAEFRELDPYRALKEAHAAGKVIQIRMTYLGPDNPDEEWEDDSNPQWERNRKYRIKPEPIKVPLEARDIPPASVFRRQQWVMANVHAYVTPSVWRDGISVSAQDSNFYVPYSNLIRDGWQINRSLSQGKWNPDAWEECHKLKDA